MGSTEGKTLYPFVVKVDPRQDFTLAVMFDNGREGILDMKPYLNFGVFRRIKKYADFKRVRISFDTIEWDGGIDLDPEFIYAKCAITSKA